MAEGTKDYRWEYEETLLFDDKNAAAHTAGLWGDALRDNLDYRKGEVEIIVSDGVKLTVRYSWQSETKAWIKTDGKYYGLAIMPKAQPSLIIRPAHKIELPKRSFL